MNKSAYYKNLFLTGAFWNWLATLPLLLGYKWLFPLFGMDLPTFPAFLILFLGLAFIFGVGYYWVSRDITKNQDIVKMGIIGKLFVFAVLFWAGIVGQIAWPLVFAGVIDLVFAVLFIEFLIVSKNHLD